MDSTAAKTASSPLIRFVKYLRPYSRFVVGAALMGVGKFTLPLAFPLVFKYVVDVLLVSTPKLDGATRLMDRWCTASAGLAGLHPTPSGKLAVLTIAMLLLYGLQSVASFYRNYWAGLAGNRLIFDLQCRLFSHLQGLPHAFFDRNPA